MILNRVLATIFEITLALLVTGLVRDWAPMGRLASCNVDNIPREADQGGSSPPLLLDQREVRHRESQAGDDEGYN